MTDRMGMIRKARIADVIEIQKILRDFAGEGRLLARPLSELYTHLRDMLVCLDEESGEVIGCCSLHIVWENLAEIRSLAVLKDRQGRGIGRDLVTACVEEARELGIARIFTLTYEVEFFRHLGFHPVDKNMFPQKVWADCLHCPKFPNCDETALVLDLPE